MRLDNKKPRSGQPQGKEEYLLGANNGRCSHRQYNTAYRDKQPLNFDAYLKQVLKACNTYENSDGLTVDCEMLLHEWPSLPRKRKFRRGRI